VGCVHRSKLDNKVFLRYSFGVLNSYGSQSGDGIS
jgi:hypothetical protein